MASDFEISESDYFNGAESVILAFYSWIDGYVQGPYGKIPRLRTTLNTNDKIGELKVRFGIDRNNYIVPAGLYAVGNPDKSSPVLATANYKLTVDKLRSCIDGLDAWIIVADTKGINVWCAAGKGTFGTNEVIKKIKELKLKELVNHRRIILPQLCAPGVASYQVRKHSGFKAVFGPIMAEDIKEFLSNDMKASEEMRTVRFDAISRLVLTPIEVVHNIKLLLIMLALVLLYNMINIGMLRFGTLLYSTYTGFLPLFFAVITGCVIVPLLLPYIPFRSFAIKGMVAGIVLDIAVFLFADRIPLLAEYKLMLISYMLLIPAVTALISLNFTGSSTYTSFSGAKLETKIALPIIKAAIALSILSALVSMML